MRRLRISIAGLMGVVLLAAMAFAALRHPSDLLVSTLFTADLVVLGVAVLGAAFGRGRRRRSWAGFALFLAGYLWAAFAWPFPGPPALLTTWGLSRADASFRDARPQPKLSWGYYDVSVPLSTFTTLPTIDPASFTFFQVGHSLAALGAGCVGAGIAVAIGGRGLGAGAGG